MTDIFDLTIIGSGPTGLYAAYYAGFRGLKVKIVDSLEELGGQVMALYPEKYIYDVAGFPKILGKDLIRNLAEQGLQYHPAVCLGERALMIRRGADGVYTLSTSKTDHHSRVILVTMGVGAFNPKRLAAPGADRLEGKGLSYFVKDIVRFAGKKIVIVGGGDSAVDWTLNLLPYASSVMLVHRRDGFRAHEESVRLLKESTAALKLFYEVMELRGRERLEEVVIRHAKTGAEETLPADEMVACLGFEATMGTLPEWGLKLSGNFIDVGTRMETNLPGVYAAGDIAAYPGKVKLISCGLGEAAIAVNNAVAYLKPGASVFPGHSTNRPR